MDRVEALRSVGVDIYHEDEWVGEPGTPERHAEPLTDTVRGLNPNFTPAEWCSIAQREGTSYVGGCCGNMSYLQDEIEGIFRDSGYMDGYVLLRIAETCKNHDGFDEFDPMDDETFEKLIASWKGLRDKPRDDAILECWAALGLIYNGLEPMLKPYYLDTPHAEHNTVNNEARVLGSALSRLEWADFFASTTSRADAGGQHAANTLLQKARCYLPAKRLIEHLEADVLDWKGYALVNPGSDDPLSNGNGQCLFDIRDEAERVLELWHREADDNERSDPVEAEIVEATITAAAGLEIQRLLQRL